MWKASLLCRPSFNQYARASLGYLQMADELVEIVVAAHPRRG
jgi:hypothetical protein